MINEGLLNDRSKKSDKDSLDINVTNIQELPVECDQKDENVSKKQKIFELTENDVSYQNPNVDNFKDINESFEDIEIKQGNENLKEIPKKDYEHKEEDEKQTVSTKKDFHHQCEFCDNSFISENALKSHIEKDHQDFINCEFCNEKFHYIDDMSNHLSEQHSKKRQNFSCDWCDKIFNSNFLKRYHHIKNHKEIMKDEKLKKISYVLLEKVDESAILTKSEIGSENRELDNPCEVENDKSKCENYKEVLDKVIEIERESKSNIIGEYQGDVFNLEIEKKEDKMKSIDLDNNDGNKKEIDDKNPIIEKRKLYYTNDSLICPQCGSQFSTKNSYTNHLTYFHSDQLFSCSTCDKKFKSLLSYRLHIKSKHEEPNSFKCEFCFRAFSHNFVLVRHKKLVHKIIPEDKKCQFCEKTFKTKISFQQHLHKEHGDTFICSYCNKKFESHKLLKNHIDVEHKGMRFLKCEKCGDTFKTKHGFKNHIKRVHLHKKYIAYKSKTSSICKLCPEKFNDKLNLKMHIAIVHGKKEPKNCQDCQTIIFDLRHYCRKKDAICHLCDVNFKSHPEKLEEHLRTKHENECEILKCDDCDQIFHSPETLSHHSKTIHQLRIRQCEYCQSYLSSNKRLKDHIQDVHNDLKLTCQYCEEKFDKSYILNRHLLEEHPNKTQRYPCKNCDRLFANLKFLKKS